MIFYVAAGHIGEFIMRELLSGMERGSVISGVGALCTIFILNDIKAVFRRIRKLAISESNEIIDSSGRE
jgi:hypothetical protein